jgi:FAD/FMN-containing dehydrogenase
MDTTNPSQHRVTLPDECVAALKAAVGAKGWIDDAARLEPYLMEERGRFRGRCAAVLRPASTAEVADVVRICAGHRVPIVAQGGNTGLVGGAVPDGGVVVALDRLNRIRAIDVVNRTMTVEAGVILGEVQSAAAEVGALFPLSLAAEGSCRIGGNLATNAGGIQVLRYGNARDLVLGLEVVLADGRVWDGLTALRKNNTGYDLKQLFLGSEGTLGIITAAVLKLFPQPKVTETALAAVPSVDAAVQLYRRTGDAAGDALAAFEFMARLPMEMCLKHIAGTIDPFDTAYPFYVLMKLTSPRAGDPLRETIETALAEAFEAGTVLDAVIASNETQAAQLWRMRESIPEAQKHEGGSIKNDVSVPISRVAAFMDRATAAVTAALPGIRVCAFGHIGDGNVHFNLSQPPGADRAAYLAEWERIEALVTAIAHDLGGSFSAEHGIGRLKRGTLRQYKSAVEIDLMRRIKHALDPDDIMNPGKVLPSD